MDEKEKIGFYKEASDHIMKNMREKITSEIKFRKRVIFIFIITTVILFIISIIRSL